MAKMTMDLELRLANAAVVRPGDTLIVATSHDMCEAEMAEMREQFAMSLPGVSMVVVDRCTGLAAYRPDDPTSAVGG